MIKIAGVRFFEQLDEATFDRLLSIVGEFHKERIFRFRFWQDRHRSLFGKLLFFKLFRDATCITEFPELKYDRYKRPYQTLSEKYDFNITHSGNYVFCAMTDNGRIGIDVEKSRDMSTDIADRFFSSYETDYLSGLPGSSRIDGMIKLWTLKESYMKAKGSTFLIPLDKFHFDISGGEKIKFHAETEDDDGKWEFYYRSLENGHHLSVCHALNEKIDSFDIHEINELIEYFMD